MSNHGGSAKAFRFMALPAELRLNVYRELLDGPQRHTEILRVSKAVNNESHEVLYGEIPLHLTFLKQGYSQWLGYFRCQVPEYPEIALLVENARDTSNSYVLDLPPELRKFKDIVIDVSVDHETFWNPHNNFDIDRLKWQIHVMVSFLITGDRCKTLKIQHPGWSIQATRESDDDTDDTTLPPSFQLLLSILEAKLFGKSLTLSNMIQWYLKKQHVLRTIETLKATPGGKVQAAFVRRNFDMMEEQCFKAVGNREVVGDQTYVPNAIARVDEILFYPGFRKVLNARGERLRERG